MYSTQTRVDLAFYRASIKEKRRQSLQMTKLWMVCCGLLTLDVSLIIYSSDPQRYTSPPNWMYGATLLPSNVGGYVLVAVITFVLAVAVTLVCMKQQDKNKQQEEER